MHKMFTFPDGRTSLGNEELRNVAGFNGVYTMPPGWLLGADAEALALFGVTVSEEADPEPAPPAVPSTITFRQLLIGLSRPATETQIGGFITEAEALAWAARTALPAYVESAITGMPEAVRLSARITALALTDAYRDDPLLAAAIAAAMPTATEAERSAAADAAFIQWGAL